jgi:D-hexose-6-phosphate mutarotase
MTMAKVPLGVRIPPELLERIEKEEMLSEKSKAEIVIEQLEKRYVHDSEKNGNDDKKSSQNGNNNSQDSVYLDYIEYLKEQITIKDAQIERAQITQQTLSHKIESKPLIEIAQDLRDQEEAEIKKMSRWERMKYVFR